MQTMTPGARVRAAIQGQEVDRVPFCFWHHFQPEGSGQRLAELTKAFFVDTFKLDIAKIMPDLPYPAPDTAPITIDQFRLLPRLDLNTPAFREQITCVRTLRSMLGSEYPILLTLFSPLTYAMNFLGKEQALDAVKKRAEILGEGLGTLAANLNKLMEAAIDAGASGIFFSCMGATTADLTLDDYANVGYPYDIQALRGASGGWLNTVHVHADPGQSSDQVYLEFFNRYPVSVLSWSDRLTGPNLEEARTITDKCLMGGLLERGPLTHGGETELKNEMLSAITQTKGRKFILANGCSIPNDTPTNWLYTARHLIDNLT
ncbi:uroporphyrinogen decarboxylase family protein [Ktedonospora formicarum]|uniref:Uroporphyrinogen decarboxylase n=1 Tax=Ktedonospora formicarum TaxID=2778364 RepID=A0A8J3MSC8_9CHLR|nr:uroporphyrinogen decarboxylase family protein [Ktedonospora formicarum]GHO43205.1 uroporphyrinogen decarboxylase [Ktedonospora formicarum]